MREENPKNKNKNNNQLQSYGKINHKTKTQEKRNRENIGRGEKFGVSRGIFVRVRVSLISILFCFSKKKKLELFFYYLILGISWGKRWRKNQGSNFLPLTCVCFPTKCFWIEIVSFLSVSLSYFFFLFPLFLEKKFSSTKGKKGRALCNLGTR